MKHKKIDHYPYGMSEEEAERLSASEDVYDVLETFDTLEDSLEFIKETYGIEAYNYAKKDAEECIREEKEFIQYMHESGKTEYIGFTTFDVSDNIKNYRECKRYEPSYAWFSSGRVVRVELY